MAVTPSDSKAVTVLPSLSGTFSERAPDKELEMLIIMKALKSKWEQEVSLI
jgi:hypothetical protein